MNELLKEEITEAGEECGGRKKSVVLVLVRHYDRVWRKEKRNADDAIKAERERERFGEAQPGVSDCGPSFFLFSSPASLLLVLSFFLPNRLMNMAVPVSFFHRERAVGAAAAAESFLGAATAAAGAAAVGAPAAVALWDGGKDVGGGDNRTGSVSAAVVVVVVVDD